MSFVAPLFLLAALAGAIPVLLHLIHNRQTVEVPFSTLRFLRVSVQRTRRRRYLEDGTLLALRVAALVLIAVGLAGPTLVALGRLWGGGGAAVVIVLDNSASMALHDGGRPRFEAARRAAEAVLDGLRDGDAVALVPACGPAAPELGQLSHAHETVRQALAGCKVSGERSDLAARLRQARELLAAGDAVRRAIYVITDNQALAWKGLKPDGDDEPAGDVPVVVVNVGRDPAPNVALTGLRLETPVLAAGVPVAAAVEVRNASPLPQVRHAELYVDGNREAVSPPLSLPPGGAARHEFRFSLPGAGAHRGEVRLAEEDGSALDDRLYFALVADRQIPVAVVKPRRAEIAFADDAFYLERALAPAGEDGWAVRVTSLTADELAAAPLAGYAAVFCVNLPAPDDAVALRLREYAWDGGHVFWVCGGNVDPAGYNRTNAAAHGSLLPAPFADSSAPTAPPGDSRKVAALDREHPALAPLTEPAALYQTVLVHRHLPVRHGPDDEARVLARLDDGQPLLLERRVGSGSVLLLTTGLHAEWTNLPLKPLFLPLVARLTFHLAGSEAARGQLLAGAPLVVPRAADGPAEVEVVRPTGEVLRLPAPERPGEPYRYTETHEPGIYLARSADPRRPKEWAFAVNVDPEEADPVLLPADELQRQFGKHPPIVCESPEEAAAALRKLREGKSLWEVFLALVLAALLLEAYLANRRGTTAVVPSPTPGARPQVARATV